MSLVSGEPKAPSPLVTAPKSPAATAVAPTASVAGTAAGTPSTPLPPDTFENAFWAPGSDYKNTPEYQELLKLDPADQKAAMREYVQGAVPHALPTLDAAKTNVGRALRLSSPDMSQEYGDIGSNRLASYAPMLEKLFEENNMSPEQRQEFMNSALESGLGAGAKTPFVQAAANMAAQTAIAKTKANAGAMMDAVQATKMNAGDFGSFLTSNWANLVAPIGMLLTLFGGNAMTRIVGLMGAAFGGAQLYDRYKVMSDSAHPAHNLFTSGLQEATVDSSDRANPKSLASPFSNLPQVQNTMYQTALQQTGDPKKAQALAAQAIQGIKDFQFVSSVGFGETIRTKMENQAAAASRVYRFGKYQAPAAPQATAAPQAVQ